MGLRGGTGWGEGAAVEVLQSQVRHPGGRRSRGQQRQVPAARGSGRGASDSVHPAELAEVHFLDSG